MYLKNGLANEELTVNNIQAIMDRADNFWAANQADEQVAAVTTTTPPTTQNPSTQNTAEADIAAVNRGRGQGFRGASGYGGRGRGRGGKPENFNPQNDPRGKRHESNPPWNSCTAHWLYSDKAWKCQAPLTCPMKNKTTPKA